MWHMTRNPRCRELWEGGHIDPFTDEQVDAADMADRRLLAVQRKQGISDFAGPPPRKTSQPRACSAGSVGARRHKGLFFLVARMSKSALSSFFRIDSRDFLK